ncbi:hypothetical protein AAL_04390 [Moelleriella libera RCEF 2490]|uniref:Phosphoribosylaminoimidazole-succinocarboxamide synthase n=1 Tax=Moelleriella libera RCEF 2490 TaxID=1081109 RepID=A0A168C3D9_9HYPO|nr:hypothetical protein AAL_04390 [Moelleriella libera RCEF 2490]
MKFLDSHFGCMEGPPLRPSEAAPIHPSNGELKPATYFAGAARRNQGNPHSQDSLAVLKSEKHANVPRNPSTIPPNPSFSELHAVERQIAQAAASEPVSKESRTTGGLVSTEAVNFYKSRLALFAAGHMLSMDKHKDELALAAGKVTPGVDDAPYIQYALEALTRDRESSCNDRFIVPSPPPGRQSGSHHERQNSNFLVGGAVPATGRGEHMAAHDGLLAADIPRTQHGDQDFDGMAHPCIAQNDSPTLPRNSPRIGTTAAAAISTTGHWIPVDKNRLQTIDPRGRIYPPLDFKPRILRPFPMLMLIASCALMIAGLIFSAVYSQKHPGLTPYPGSIYSGEYFVFRILPQILAAFILIFAQNIVTASLRILPFAALAKEDPMERYLGLFQKLYTTSFLLPQLSGPWQMKIFGMATWLMNLVIPLHSAAFICIYVNDDGRWVWATNNGVVWTSVALYIILLVSTCTLLSFWLGQWTGLIWDVRSIADLIPLLNRTNTIRSYRRKGPQDPKGDLKSFLRERWYDRLGYWQMDDLKTGGIWHTIGSSAVSHDVSSESILAAGNPKRRSNELSVGSHLTDSTALLNYKGGSYIPWCLRDLPLVSSVLVTGGLLTALLIVSFLPQTSLEDGFAPLLAARPNHLSFSAANFLYSFIPATLGMMLFLLFQSPDAALRRLQPWGGMNDADGAPASRSILVDYAACLPFQAFWRSTRNGHWRVAVVSLLSVLFIFIPILGGGLFMALTVANQEVRMFPSMPVFGVLLALLALYVGCLALLIPRRRQFRLPHAVDTIAHLIDLCTARELCEDAAFRSVRSRSDLMDRLGVGRRDSREESVWFFGLLAGRDENRPSVRRMRRYTEKMTLSSKLPDSAV